MLKLPKYRQLHIHLCGSTDRKDRHGFLHVLIPLEKRDDNKEVRNNLSQMIDLSKRGFFDS